MAAMYQYVKDTARGDSPFRQLASYAGTFYQDAPL